VRTNEKIINPKVPTLVPHAGEWNFAILFEFGSCVTYLHTVCMVFTQLSKLTRKNKIDSPSHIKLCVVVAASGRNPECIQLYIVHDKLHVASNEHMGLLPMVASANHSSARLQEFIFFFLGNSTSRSDRLIDPITL
jgi:hypothetical protein